MPISTSDIKFYLSGGSSNTNPNLSLGGVISTTEITSGQLHNLFDVVGNTESVAGDVEYRCIYVKNTSSTFTLNTSYIDIKSNTTSPSTSIDLSLGISAINGTEQTIVNESTSPTGMSWIIENTGNKVIGSLSPGQHKAIWVRRTVSASAVSFNNDTAIIQLVGTP
jgi:hypothetical protein